MLTSSTPDALWRASTLRTLQPAAVACRGLRRRVGRRKLLDGVTFSIPIGMRLLVVSRPEASASLLLRVLAGLARADGGRLELAGLTDPSRRGWGRRVAYLGSQPGLYPWMTAREVLHLAARLRGFTALETQRRIEWATITFGLAGLLDRQLSRGRLPLAERTAIAAALLGDPEVLLLDEPLRALSAEERLHLLDLPPRRTMLIASRYPAAEAGLCSHVMLLREGRVALLAPVRQLEAEGLSLSLYGIAALAERVALRAPGSVVAATSGAAPSGR